MGVYTVTFSLTVLHFFATFMNYRNKVLDFLSQAAYGVYILHFVLLGPAVYAYTRILEATGQLIIFTYCVAKGAWYSMTPLEGWQLFLGFLFSALLMNLVLWPLAYWLRKLPRV